MIPVITALRWVPPFAQGYVRDHRVRWALEETGRPYRVELVDHAILDSRDYRSWQPFGHVPAYRDGEVELFESGAIVLHIARTSEMLAPVDPAGFARVSAWVIAALNSVEPFVRNVIAIDDFHASEPWAQSYRPIAEAELRRRLAALQDRLADRDFLEDRFSAGDLMMSTVLRDIEASGLLRDYPAVSAFLTRCESRLAFQRAIAAQIEDFRNNAPA
jgi:glutathione S-transferase